MGWDSIATQGTAILLGGVAGGIAAAVINLATWWQAAKSETARQLLSEALTIQSEPEAWILEGAPGETKLSDVAGLPIAVPEGPGLWQGLWLRRVEVRVMLDEAPWNSPENQFYGFLEGRRAWIVRDRVLSVPIQGTSVDSRPGLLSSRAIENLVAWVERVESARSSWMLSRRGFRMLWPLLLSLASDDKVRVFDGRLPDSARAFLARTLEQYRKDFSQALRIGRGAWFRSP